MYAATSDLRGVDDPAEEAARSDEDEEQEDPEADRRLPLRGQLPDPEILQEPEEEAAQHRAGDRADAAHDDADRGQQDEARAAERLGAHVHRDEDTGRRGDGGADGV